MMIEHLRDAVRVLRPGPDDPHRVLAPLLIILTLVTGLVDAYSYLELQRVLVANMTGNVVFLGFSLGGAGEFNAWASLTAIVAFLVGALLGGRLGRTARGSQGREHHLSHAAGFQAMLLASATLVAWANGQVQGLVLYVLVLLLGVAMGLQNATARAMAVPDLMTTVLTMTLAGLTADSGAAGGDGSKAGRRLMSVATMFLGALAGASSCTHGHAVWALVAALGLRLVVAGVAHSSTAGHRRSADA